MAEPTTPQRVTVDAAALSALVDTTERCIELHAQVQMDTPEAKARHARAVDAMRTSLTEIRRALDVRALVDDVLGADPGYLGGQSVDDYIREARRDR